MRTSFTDSEDKELVQIAFQFEREGLRITWDYVARRMRTQRPAKQLRLRLASLKRTYGKPTQAFPPCFFSGQVPRRLLTASGPPPPTAFPLAQPTRSPSQLVQHLFACQQTRGTLRGRPAIGTGSAVGEAGAGVFNESVAAGLVATVERGAEGGGERGGHVDGTILRGVAVGIDGDGVDGCVSAGASDPASQITAGSRGAGDRRGRVGWQGRTASRVVSAASMPPTATRLIMMTWLTM
ncbi:hypothetical protein JG688_00016960 [Phytophthora aleatoria]|uniref:Myb-like domain-containing protein n=1 Tax=Phytophthora aleatoria TaxID=2496075 RepID=A0A8J5IRA2_9STRA|nr:hypothetical protein JG688_00016960 [Phytophthora aleatoria]